MEFNTDQIEKWYNKAKDIGIFEELSKIPDLIFNPRKFWENYEGLNTGKRWLQFFSYALVYCIMIWWARFHDSSISFLGKVLIAEIVVSITYIIIVFLGNVIVNRSLKVKFWQFVVYCCYVRFIVLLPHLICLHLYVLNESYFYLALAILTAFIAEIYLYFVSSYVFQRGWRKVLSAFIVTLLCLNIYDGIFILTGFQRSHNSNYDDIILEERFNLGKNLKGGYDIPTHVCSWEFGKKSWYLYSSPFDSIATSKEIEDTEFLKEIKEDADTLSVITERCKFEKNRQFFKMLLVQRRLIQFVHDNQIYKSNPIEKVEEIYKDSLLVDRIVFRRFSQDVDSLNQELVKFELDQHSQYENAMNVSNILVAFHPFHFIYNWNKEE